TAPPRCSTPVRTLLPLTIDPWHAAPEPPHLLHHRDSFPLLQTSPVSTSLGPGLLCPINLTLKEVPHIRWHIPTMDHLCPTPSQILFQSCRTPSSFLCTTIVVSPSG